VRPRRSVSLGTSLYLPIFNSLHAAMPGSEPDFAMARRLRLQAPRSGTRGHPAENSATVERWIRAQKAFSRSREPGVTSRTA
jgi:hypothetical protein